MKSALSRQAGPLSSVAAAERLLPTWDELSHARHQSAKSDRTPVLVMSAVVMAAQMAQVNFRIGTRGRSNERAPFHPSSWCVARRLKTNAITEPALTVSGYSCCCCSCFFHVCFRDYLNNYLKNIHTQTLSSQNIICVRVQLYSR